MSFFDHSWRKIGFTLLLISALFIVTRTVNLTKLPIFTDEAIYIRWSQIGAADANWRFISLTDGKQPMFTWIMMAFLRFIPGDPLFVGRLVSVFAGAASMLGLWLLGSALFKSSTIGLIASILYLFSPFSLMYDRMALYDALVATFSIWNLYIALLLVRTIRLDVALILGMTLGLGMLNKTSGFLNMYLLPVTVILFDWKQKQRLVRLLRWAFYIGIAVALSQLIYSVLRLSPYFHIIKQKDAVFIYPFRDWIGHPFLFIHGNLRGMFDWMRNYLTLPIFIGAFLALFLTTTKKREAIVLFLWWAVPFVGLGLFARILYPRFILFMAMPLLVLSAVALHSIMIKVGKTPLGTILLILFFSPSLITDYFIITNPKYAPIPYADKGQYISDWPSGWGIREVNEYLLEQSRHQTIAVYTDGTFGLLPYALEIYLVRNPNISIRGIWPLPSTMPQEVLDSVAAKPTYLVVNQTRIIPADWVVELIAAYPKANPAERPLRLFKVMLPKASAEKKVLTGQKSAAI